MARWWLFNGWGESRQKALPWLPFSARIHFIATADEDRELHDHPWPARTIILKGWYRETRLVNPEHTVNGVPEPGYPMGEYFTGGEQVEFTRRPGDTSTLDFCEFHRITEISEGGVYTLFISWPWAGDWGFLSPTGLKVWWREWLGIHKGEEAPLRFEDVRPDADDPALLRAERARAEWRRTQLAEQMRRVMNDTPEWPSEED